MRRLQPRARVAPTLLWLLSLALLPSRALAGCDNIPSASDVFRAAQGAITAPFAIPGESLQVRVRPEVCDGTSVGLGTPPACVDDSAVRVTLIFESRDGAPVNAVVLARDCGSAADPGSLQSRVAAWAGQLGAGATATCQADPTLDVLAESVESTQECRLDFRFPTATGSALQLPNTLTGPTRIVVEPIASPLPTGLIQTRCADAVATSGTIACIDELYRTDGSCSTQAASLNGRFPEFTALPIPNDFAAMADTGNASHPALRFALDAAGNVLAPMKWSGVLCQTDPNCGFQGFPPPQLVQVLFPHSIGSGLDATGQPVASGDPLSIPSGEFTSSHTLEGKELPPIFDPSSSSASLALFGSTDAVQTVIRIQTQAPGRCSSDQRPCISDAGCAGSATTQSCDLGAPDLRFADLRYCRHPNACQAPDLPFTALPVSGGPGLVPSSLYTASTEGFVPLEALNLCRNSDELSCVLKNEPLAADDANGDGDATDPAVIQLRDRRAGTSLPIGFDGISGLATTLLSESPAAVGPFGQPLIEPPSAPSVRPAVVTDGSCAALLFAEPWENAVSPLGMDANGDGEAFNPILRVFCRTAPGAVEEVAVNAAEAAGFGSLLGASARPLLLASSRTLSPLQGGGEPLVFAGDRLYLLLDELANSPKGTQRVDVNALGQPAQGPASAPALSFSGDVACFMSSSDLLANGSPNTSRFDVYCSDLRTGAVDLVSREQQSSAGGSLCGAPIGRANSSSYKPSLSDDGRFVCFESDARNLLAGGADANSARDVFVYDRSTCRTARISVTSGGTEPAGASSACSMAGGAAFAAFASDARLVPEDVDADSDAYLVPLLGGDSDTNPLHPGIPLLLSGGLTGRAGAPSVSADGTRVAFELGDADGTHAVVRDVVGGVAHDVVSFHFEGKEPKLSEDGHSLTLVTTDAATGLPVAALVDLVASIARNEPVQQPLALTSTLQDVDAKSFEARAQTHTAVFVSPEPLTPLDSPSLVDSEVHVRDLDTGFLKRVGDGSRFPSLSGDGSAVAYLEPSSNGTSAFRRGPVPGAGVDFDGDGSAKDLVLAAIDLSSAPPTLDVIGAATQAAVAGPVAAFLAPDGRVFVRSCPAGTSCAPTPLLAPGGAAPAHATAVAASESVVCAILSDGGDVACAAPGESALTGLGFTGRALGIVGDDVVFTSGEQPARLMTFHRTGSTFASKFAGGPGTRRFVLSENGFAAFDRCELDAGVDLNGDGIEDECVLDLLDLATSQLVETKATVLPCTLQACDRRFPWRLFPAGATGKSATARFLSVECQEDGTCSGCSAQSCPVNGRACDLDQDGDCADVVVREVSFGAAPVVLTALAEQVDSDPLAGDVSGGVGGQGAVFPTLIGRCDVDTDPATEPSTRPCQTSADCPTGLVCGPPFSALALNDGDGDGIFDGADNCPDTFNPDQADADGNGIGDACQVNRCGDGVVSAKERCDDGARNGACEGLSVDQCRARGAAGSFCDATCAPQVFVKADRPFGSLLPTTIFGTPFLNLGAALAFNGSSCAIPGGCPDAMIDLTSVRLEGVPTGGACLGAGAPIFKSYFDDVNHDGITDLVTKYLVGEAKLDPGDKEVCVTGQLRAVDGRFDAAPFAVHAKLPLPPRCGFGAELAPILAGVALLRRRSARKRRA